MSAHSDPELDLVLADVAAAVEDDLLRDGGCPDLAAVVALAHRLDPEAVPQAAVDEVSAWAPVVTLGEGRRRRATRDDPELLALMSDVRAHVEQEVVDRFAIPERPSPTAASMSASPSGPIAPIAEPTPLAPRRVWAGVLAAAAALVLVAAGIVTGVLVSRDDAQALPQSAVHQDPPAHGERSTIRGDDEASARRRTDGRGGEPDAPAAVPDEEPPSPEVEIEAAPKPQAGAAPARKRTVRRGKPAPAAARAPTLEELDDRAHVAWRAGDLAQAEAAFREIVARGGRSGRGGRLADLAYGDLFTLARQSGKPDREAKLWREYVRAFPSGRFADDARAGLCRRADGTARRECWAAYLEAMPEGSHRAQATRELARPAGEK